MRQNWVCKGIWEALNELTLTQLLISQFLSWSVRHLINFSGLVSPTPHRESPGLPALAKALQPGRDVTQLGILIKQMPEECSIFDRLCSTLGPGI